MAANRQILVIACAVFKEVIPQYIREASTQVVFMEYGLHLTPRKLSAAIQEQIDAQTEPRLVLIGFGLCGNGLIGLKSRSHTLILPRVDDCVALHLGSQADYLAAFQAEPATYYLTPGWLECGGEPMSEHEKCRARFGPEKADLISDALYGQYRRTCLITFTAEDLARYRPRAMQVAAFCRERWGWQYQERVGSDALIKRLLDAGNKAAVASEPQDSRDFLVIDPGGEVSQEMYLPSLDIQEEALPHAPERTQ